MEAKLLKVWKFGDNINTDEIIPARFLNDPDPRTLAKYCMADAKNSEFTATLEQRAGLIEGVIIGGEYFGCGSSREHAPISIKATGISYVIAKDFAPIFYRNCINTGLAIIECPEAAEELTQGNLVEVDINKGIIFNRTLDRNYVIPSFSHELKEIIDAGGLINFAKKQQ